MKRKINPVGFLSLVSIIALLGITTDNRGWFGFLAFLYYLRYFFVAADESFWENIKRASAMAFFAEMLTLTLAIIVTVFLMDIENALPVSFGLSFSAAVLFFTLSLAVSEWKELNSLSDD